MTTDKHIPPQSLDSEMAILGAIFVDNNAINTVLDSISVDDFYRESHRKIFKAMVTLSECGEPCDFVIMVAELTRKKCLEEIGGAAYLLELVDHVPTSANVGHYCKIVLEMSTKRRFLDNARKTLAMIESGKTSDEIAETAESDLVNMSRKDKNEPVSAPQLIKEAVTRLKKRYSNKGALQGMSWGIDNLDEATTGIQKGDLIIIAGRPSMGKTVLEGNIMRSICTNGLSGLMFSLEMSRVDCTDRMTADVGNVKYHHLRTGQLTDVEWSKYTRSCEEIKGWKLFIDDTPAVTLRQIKSKAKRRKKEGLDIIGVDYLQLMGVSSRENRTQSLGEISRGLKQLARELDIAVILLSQLNRSVDSRPDKRPLMSDLRDSGEIEQDADVILFPFRPAEYCQKCRDKVDDESHSYLEHQSQAEIIIEKQRSGERNLSIPVTWLGQFQRFEGINNNDMPL